MRACASWRILPGLGSWDFRVGASGFRVWGVGFRVEGFRVQGFGFKVSGAWERPKP